MTTTIETDRALVICGVGETRIPLLRDASASEDDWEAFYRSTNSTGARLANQARNEGGWCVTVRAADVDESDLDADPAVRSYCTERRAAFAAIGDDGRRPVVWGVGDTEAEARADAAESLRDAGSGDDSENLRVVEISAERRAKIEGGEVGAEDL